MATPSMDGLLAELESLKDRLKEAISEGDDDKIRYLEERIDRVENDIQGIKDYESVYGK